MPSFFRSCILAAMVSSSLIACDDESLDTDPAQLRSSDPPCGTGPASLRELYDPYDLLSVEDLTIEVFVDPKTAPKDISTGVIEGEASILLEGSPVGGTPLKIKVKVVVMPADWTAGG